MCQNSITCQSKLSFWLSKIKIGPLLSYFIFKYFISLKISQVNYNLLTPISHPFHLTSFLRLENLKRKLTVCSVSTYYNFINEIDHGINTCKNIARICCINTTAIRSRMSNSMENRFSIFI